MKQARFLPVVMALVLAVAFVSCTPMQQATGDDEYYTETRRTTANRIYVDDPYLGVVVLERDPWSGRYYQLSPGGLFSPYNSGFYGGGFNNPYNRGGYYRRAPVQRNSPQQPNTEERSRQRSEARKRVLGE